MSGLPQGRARVMKPCHKLQQLQPHKPRVPSRLSLCSLPPLPALPPLPCDSWAKTPTLLPVIPARKRSASSPPAEEPTPTPKRARPTPRPRAVAVEDALHGVGAVYIGWEQGKADPAPLCCPVEKEKIKQRFGEASVGWMTVPAQPSPQMTNLPVLPSLSIPQFVDTPSASLLVTSSFSPSPPSLVHQDDSSSASSVYSSVSPPPTISMGYSFDTTTSTTTSDYLLFPNSNLSTASQTLALPLSDTQGQQERVVPSIKVEDKADQFDFSDVVSEALWSADEGGFFSTGGCSSGGSEASWAW